MSRSAFSSTIAKVFHARLRTLSATSTKIPATFTPILDRQAPLPQPAEQGMGPVRVLLELALIMIVIVPFFWRQPPFIVHFERWFATHFKLLMANPDWAGVRLLLTGLAIALVCSAAIAIHECGHLLAGLALGFRCKSFRFGRVKIEPGWKISRYQNPEDAALGWAHMVPVRWQRLRPRTAAMILAGPMANLLSAYLQIKLWPDQSLISGSFLGVSIFMGLLNLLPIRIPGHISDGQKLLMLLFDRRRSERYLALLKLEDQLRRRIPAALLDPAALEGATSMYDTSAETAKANLLAYLAACSRGDYLRAAEFLEVSLKASGGASSLLREMLALQAASFQATQRKRLDLAEQWLGEAGGRRVLLAERSRLEEEIAKHKKSVFKETSPTGSTQ